MNESAVVTRAIEVMWGGEQKVLPVLPMELADKWRILFVKKFPEQEPTVKCPTCSGSGFASGGVRCEQCKGSGSIPKEMDASQAMALTGTKLVDLLLNYDRSKVLGTREWIKANVTDDELADAFVEVYRRTFRLSRLPVELTRAMLAPQQPARSPNGRSPTGALTPINSGADSPTSN